MVVNHVKLLPASNDDHEGVIVDMKEPMEPDVFLTLLRASLSLWRQQAKRGVWIKLPIELVNLVETAVKEGFWYHRAEPSYLMLVYWIPETASTIPANASHRVGIGAIVINDKREVFSATSFAVSACSYSALLFILCHLSLFSLKQIC
ncbi:hypothetical protein MANES_08G095901v8 [Manihot esculenta]|uniref:Uncharacterized protein n=1 Tax=Manihot esculenta TaxID=3983 RepID=A0ACB7HC93_MANES|nr:hypothetical protein MANES_08G095901v8 [Manihot esculenta]